MNRNPYLSSSEAASELGLSPRRLRQLRYSLGAIEIGSTLAFPVARIEAEKKKGRPKRGPKKKLSDLTL